MIHTIELQKIKYLANTNDNLLDLLIKENVPINYACQLGNCQSCLIKCTKGTVNESAQLGLKSTLKAQGYLLACQCKITSNMTLSHTNLDALRIKTSVLSVNKKTPDLMILKLSIPTDFDFEAGQSVILWKNETSGRNYSIASLMTDNCLELHIKKYDDGCLTPWLFNDINVGDELTIQGPSGSCFYTKTKTPLLLIGNGTGLSPLVGIVKSALKHGHTQTICLIHYVREKTQRYYHQELKQLSEQHKQFTYTPLIDDDATHKAIIELARKKIIENKHHTIYLAGSEGLVNTLRKQLYIAGASLASIYSDAFIPHTDASEQI